MNAETDIWDKHLTVGEMKPLRLFLALLHVNVCGRKELEQSSSAYFARFFFFFMVYCLVDISELEFSKHRTCILRIGVLRSHWCALSFQNRMSMHTHVYRYIYIYIYMTPHDQRSGSIPALIWLMSRYTRGTKLKASQGPIMATVPIASCAYRLQSVVYTVSVYYSELLHAHAILLLSSKDLPICSHNRLQGVKLKEKV